MGIAALLSGGLLAWQRFGQAPRNLAPYTVLAKSGSLPGVVTANGEIGRAHV